MTAKQAEHKRKQLANIQTCTHVGNRGKEYDITVNVQSLLEEFTTKAAPLVRQCTWKSVKVMCQLADVSVWELGTSRVSYL